MKKSKSLLVLLALVTLATKPAAHAGPHTWSGAASGQWSVAGNWSVGGPPVNGETVSLTFPVGAAHFAVTNDLTGLQVDSLTFSAPGYTVYAAAGKTITLTGGINILCNDNAALDTSLGIVLANTNSISVTTGKQLTIMGPISGPGALAKIGGGALMFSGTPANTYSGSTLLSDGSLVLQRGVSAFNTAVAVPGPLFLGGSNGAPDAATATLNFPDQIAKTAPVTTFYSGTLNLNTVNQTIGSLFMYGGSINGSDSLLTLNGDVTAVAGTNSASIHCLLSLGGTNRTFNVTGNYGLQLQNRVSDGGSNVGLTKTGPGLLYLVASNSYAGLTVVSSGTLELGNGFALGSPSSGTIVSNGASIRFLGSFGVGAEPLTLYGLGVNSVGSIYTDFDTNSWAGPVVLASNTRVQTLNGVCRLSFTGPITGPGGLDKIGEGTLNFSGTSSNRYAGITTVSVGKLELSKTNATAIPGPLTIGDNVTPTNNATVQSLRINQIEDTAPVVVNSSGTLSFDPFNAPSETIGSLAGAGHVNLMLTALTLAGNADTTFDGVISGFNAGQILKTGYGVWTLNGTNNSIGATFVNAGKIVVNGASVGPLQLNFFSALGGTGVVGDVSGTLAKIAPGNSVGRITTGNLMLMNGSSSLDVQLNGTTPGSGYDQILVNGGVNLTNPTLNVSMTFPGAVGNQYVIIANDFSDAINGTFKNLPEGTNFLAGGAQFQITYKGGDGNDVVLTQMTAPTPSQIGGITSLPNGQIGLSGSGSAGASYDIEANLDLGTTNWVKLGTVQAGQNGAISFIDLDAPNHAMRFYRFKAQ